MSETHLFNPEKLREDFPILKQKINGHPLVYFDSAASTQKPQSVIDAISDYYSNEHSNVHRGVHTLSSIATKKYEDARVKIQKFINSSKWQEVIFCRGTTEAIN